jgi:hypothetical protein
MQRKEDLQGNNSESDDSIEEWFAQRGVTLLDTVSGSETEDETWLKKLGIIDSRDNLLANDVVTAQFLGHNKDFGDGWFRGGAESFYKIVEIRFRSGFKNKRKFVAYKAIHSMGDIKSKVICEAARMAEIATHGRCGKVYAAGNGTIIKDFLEEDPQESLMSLQMREQEEREILELLDSLGLKPLGGKKVEVIQHKGKLMLIDLGSGDISGPDLAFFLSLVLR